MPKMNWAVINCSNITYKLKKWKQEICYAHNDFESSCKREDCIHCCVSPFKFNFSKHIEELEVNK